MRITSLLVMACAGSLVACAAAPATSSDEVDGDVGATSEALIADPCATSGPNITFDITKAHTSQSYTRTEVWIDSICPNANESRPTTVVEFDLAKPSTKDNYTLHISADFGDEVDNPVGCPLASLAFNYYWYDEASGAWEEGVYGDRGWTGIWAYDSPAKYFEGHCTSLDEWDFWGPRSNPYADNITNTRIRVHALATRPDGTHPDVTIKMSNDGP